MEKKKQCSGDPNQTRNTEEEKTKDHLGEREDFLLIRFFNGKTKAQVEVTSACQKCHQWHA